MGGSRELAPDPVTFRPPFVSLAPGATWVRRLLVATVAVGWVAFGANLAKLRLLIAGPAQGGITEALRWAQERTGSVLEAAQLMLFAATAAAFLHWLYDARVNLRAFGVRRPRYSRNWTLGAFFVPVLNAFRPYQVAAEIWQASDPGTLDPFDWRKAPTPRLLSWWWAACLAALVLLLLSLALGATAGVNLGRLRVATWLATFGDLAAIAAAMVSRGFVDQLTAAQQAKWERIQGGGVSDGEGRSTQESDAPDEARRLAAATESSP